MISVYLLLDCPEIRVFYLGDRKFYLGDKFFSGLWRNFFGPAWCAQQPSRNFLGPRIIKDIKVFRAKKFGFNNSSNYSGGFIIANCAGKKCTASCLWACGSAVGGVT